MTSKEKAEELCNKYFIINQESSFINNIDATKQCALITVDEILNIKSVDRSYELSTYWEEVKQEIEKL